MSDLVGRWEIAEAALAEVSPCGSWLWRWWGPSRRGSKMHSPGQRRQSGWQRMQILQSCRSPVLSPSRSSQSMWKSLRLGAPTKATWPRYEAQAWSGLSPSRSCSWGWRRPSGCSDAFDRLKHFRSRHLGLNQEIRWVPGVTWSAAKQWKLPLRKVISD